MLTIWALMIGIGINEVVSNYCMVMMKPSINIRVSPVSRPSLLAIHVMSMGGDCATRAGLASTSRSAASMARIDQGFKVTNIERPGLWFRSIHSSAPHNSGCCD